MDAMDTLGRHCRPHPARRMGSYSQYQGVAEYEGIFYSIDLPNGDTVRITCVDIVEDNVDAKLALITEEFRQGALEAVEERRASS